MKKIFLMSALACSSIFAISQTGIYRTADDYLNGRLDLYREQSEKHSLKTDIPFNPSAIKVIKGRTKYELDKWNTYGFKKKNQDYRFYESKSFRIIDPSYFPIYAREENIVNGKAKTRETRYYFSRNADAPILELTIANLKTAFPNRAFHNWIDMHFGGNDQLLAFDNHYNEYKLKSIYNKTIN